MPNKTKKNMKKIRGGDPTLSSNINKAASIGMQLGNDLVSIGLNKVAELTGQNPNLPLDKSIKEIGNKLEGVQKALETKEGEKILNNLGKLAGEVGEDIVGPAIEKASNVVLEKSGEIGNKAVSAGIDVLAATPIAPLIEIPKFVSDVSTGVMKSAEAASDVLSIGSDSIKELKEKQEKASGIISDLQNLVENSGETLNKGLNSGLNMVESKTKELNDYVDKNTPEKLDKSTREGLIKRWAFFDKSFTLNKNNIKSEKVLNWAQGVDKNDHQKISKDNIRPFEDIFLGVGAEVLSFMSSVLTVNPDEAIRSIKTRLDQTIKDVKTGGDPKKVAKLKMELERLEAIGGVNKIVPIEGIVFQYPKGPNGRTMKLTGSFASVNQLLGIFFNG